VVRASRPRTGTARHEVTVYLPHILHPAGHGAQWHALLRLPTIRTKHLETVVHTFLSTLHAMAGGLRCDSLHAWARRCFISARLVGKKTVVTVQGLDWQRAKWSRCSPAFCAGEGPLPSRYPMQPSSSRRASALLSRPHERETIYIPNGAAPYSGVPKRLHEWNLSRRYILYLGRFSPEKNCHLLIEAFEKAGPA